MCASPHNSPAVQGMMCEQVVAATRDLEEVVSLETAVFLVPPKEGSCDFFVGCCRPRRPIRRHSGRKQRFCGKDLI